jgi:hypothetical protein
MDDDRCHAVVCVCVCVLLLLLLCWCRDVLQPTKAGLAAAIGMCIHNLPEGIAVYISCLRGAVHSTHQTHAGHETARHTRHARSLLTCTHGTTYNKRGEHEYGLGRGLDVGLSLAVAIIIHVIPEGMAITALMYHSTGRCTERHHDTPQHVSHTAHYTPHATRHTPHATRHTPHATRHTPHATRHTPHATRHARLTTCSGHCWRACASPWAR